MIRNEQLRLSHKKKCNGVKVLPWIRRSRKSVFFATQICTLQAGTVLFPTLFEAFLPVVFKYWRVGVVIDCSRPFIFP